MAKKRPPPDPRTTKMATYEAEPPKAKAKAPSSAQTVKLWDSRLARATKTYDEWEKTFECQHLDDYYEGKQWRGVADGDAKKKYTINLVFATVESQLPSILFTRPKVKAEARPGPEQTAGSEAAARATLVEQSIQTVMDDPKVRFSYETDLALRDGYSRYGLIEVGYSADWIDNPNADRPVLKEDNSPLLGDDGEPVTAPKKILKPGTKESCYVRRLDPACCRASPGRNALLTNDWVAYYEWVPVEDVRRNRDYTHAKDVHATGKLQPLTDEDVESADETDQRVGMVKLWKIWDLRQKVRHIHAEGHDHLLQENKPFTYLPLAVLKFYERRNAFLPLPPIYNWLGPQDEINETREMQKIHRRRALRRYMYEGGIEDSELEKLGMAEDLMAIRVPKVVPPPIVPIADAPLDVQNWTELAASRDDLNQISGVSGEARNTPDAPTATQANIVNVRASIRESRARQQVADWLAEIARLILLTMRERVKLPFMVKKTVDPFNLASQHTQDTARLWTQIESEDIDTLDVDISIDVASLSPVAEDAQRNQWNIVLALLTNPALASLLMTPNPEAPDDPSPLLRKTLVLNGITSDQEIREIWRVGQAILQQAAQAAASAAALEKQPEPPKVSFAFKGEDFLNPVIGPIALKLLMQGEATPTDAMQLAVPEPALVSGNGSSGMSMPGPQGLPTGMPAKAPTGVA